MSLWLLIFLPFTASLVAAVLPANARNIESVLAGLTALWCAVQTALLFPAIAHGGVVEAEFSWLPELGLNPIIRIDGFAWMFCMLVFGIGALVVLYARYYLSPTDPVPRFFSFLLAFMGAMAGVVVAANLIQLVFFWELTSLFSFLLIGYWHHRSDARRGARMALTVTAIGGLALLAAMLLLGHIVGSYTLDATLAAGDRVREHPLYDVTLALTLLGAFTKSAQFPFHFWLPHAMAAPTPVSSTCTRPPWSRPASSSWHACGRSWEARPPGSGGWAGRAWPHCCWAAWRPCSSATSRACWPIPPFRIWGSSRCCWV